MSNPIAQQLEVGARDIEDEVRALVVQLHEEGADPRVVRLAQQCQRLANHLRRLAASLEGSQV